MADYDLDRIVRIANEGLERDRDGEEDVSMDSFAIVVIYNVEDEEGVTREETAVYSESSRNFHKLGILHSGIERLNWDDE